MTNAFPHGVGIAQPGLSQRDYVATRILQSMWMRWPKSFAAWRAYRLSDALLREGRRKPTAPRWWNRLMRELEQVPYLGELP